MIIAGRFSFNGGAEFIHERYPLLLAEVESIVAAVNAEEHKTKVSTEKTMPGRILYSPSSLNRTFKRHFYELGWRNKKVLCDYPSNFYTDDYVTEREIKGAFRDMDFVKEQLGVEVQFGKYAFMVYNVCSKMTIFKNLGIIDAGIEIVPIRQLASQMSTGVSYFEQFVWDLRARGVADIDIPVLILGIYTERALRNGDILPAAPV
ncbi:MAG TPA: BglII/BstYI family type II restriction endonuclease [Chloroflexia bacterium]|jgi:hypothetical protein